MAIIECAVFLKLFVSLLYQLISFKVKKPSSRTHDLSLFCLRIDWISWTQRLWNTCAYIQLFCYGV